MGGLSPQNSIWGGGSDPKWFQTVVMAMGGPGLLWLLIELDQSCGAPPSLGGVVCPPPLWGGDLPPLGGARCVLGSLLPVLVVVERLHPIGGVLVAVGSMFAAV